LKPNRIIGLVLAGIVSIFMLVRLFPPVYAKSPADGKSASAEAPHWGEGGVPQFQFDSAFPKIPKQWRMGFGTAISSDSDGNIWILSRPDTVKHPRNTPPDLTSTAAPPVMEFDNAGNFIRGWGGQDGPGYQWPSSEHGLMIDYKGYVWIIGAFPYDPTKYLNPPDLPHDNQILKFTKDGKFVMQIGHNGQNGSNATEVLASPTDMWLYPKTNELFVSDGYQNARVVVYDADTGKFKRMWGAYGHTPLDVDKRLPHPPLNADPSKAEAYVLQQFSTPHDIKVSSDGLVYVADRGNRRIQVFTIDGKFLTEQFIALDLPNPSCRGIAFSPDERFMYVGGSGFMWILNRRTLEVLGQLKVGPLVGETPGHLIGTDKFGNLLAVRAQIDGAEGDPHVPAYKYVFKGYSPKVPCPGCETVRPDLVK
jgi:hypothetical protein